MSGEILEFVWAFHQRDAEGPSPIGKGVLLVVACDFEGEAMPIYINVDHLIVSVEDLDRRARKEALCMFAKVIIIGV